MGDTEDTGLWFNHQVIGSQAQEGFQLQLIANNRCIEMAGTEGDRIERLVVLHWTGKKMSHTSDKFWPRPCAPGLGDIDILADQPAAKS